MEQDWFGELELMSFQAGGRLGLPVEGLGTGLGHRACLQRAWHCTRCGGCDFCSGVWHQCPLGILHDPLRPPSQGTPHISPELALHLASFLLIPHCLPRLNKQPTSSLVCGRPHTLTGRAVGGPCMSLFFSTIPGS